VQQRPQSTSAQNSWYPSQSTIDKREIIASLHRFGEAASGHIFCAVVFQAEFEGEQMFHTPHFLSVYHHDKNVDEESIEEGREAKESNQEQSLYLSSSPSRIVSPLYGRTARW
jgi:hypothetical protein